MRYFQKKIEKDIPSDTVDKMRGKFDSMAEKLKTESENLSKNEYVRKSLEGISKAGGQIADVSRSLGSTEFVKSAKEVRTYCEFLIYRVLQPLKRSFNQTVL